jgi:type I restriction enzyme S subunit
MTAQLLMDEFERVVNAPDATAELRQFLIDTAVRGRLIPQHSQDRMELEVPPVAPDAATPTALLLAEDRPLSWLMTSIENCFEKLEDGRTLHQGWSPQCEPRPATDGEWGMLKTTAIQTGKFEPEHNKFLPKHFEPRPVLQVAVGDLLITCAGPRARCGITCLVRIAPPRRLISGKMYRFRVKSGVAPEYMELFLQSGHARQAIDRMKTGSSESGMNLTHERFRQLPVLIPPLAEQHRIVAKIDELMVLCDQLEAAQKEREAQRDALRAVSLHRLTRSDDGGERMAGARFFLDATPRLITKPGHVAAVRQSIFGMAVRGQLEPQVSGDEAVGSLLARVDRERMRAWSGHGSRAPAAPDVQGLSITVPPTWEIVSLDRLITFGPKNGISPRETNVESAPKAITLTATTSGIFDASQYKRVDASIPENSEYWLQPGDLLFQRGNTREYVGIAAPYYGDPGQLIYPDLMIKVRLSQEVRLPFVHLCTRAPEGRAYMSARASGAQKTMPKINQRILCRFPVPLPPLAEQDRIVAKVDRLMTVCDQLEVALGSAQNERARLLQTLLQGALAEGSNRARLSTSSRTPCSREAPRLGCSVPAITP